MDEDIDADDVGAPDEDELDEELDEELDDELEEDDLGLPSSDDDDEAAGQQDDGDDDEDEPVVARRKPASEDDEDDDEDLNPDDVEADLDAILKDRIAAGTDEDDEDEGAEDRTDAEGGERVAAKSAEEFTCSTCFMIVHPRQFGRTGHLVCPEGYDPCPSIKVVEQRNKKAAKK